MSEKYEYRKQRCACEEKGCKSLLSKLLQPLMLYLNFSRGLEDQVDDL